MTFQIPRGGWLEFEKNKQCKLFVGLIVKKTTTIFRSFKLEFLFQMNVKSNTLIKH